ncbi:MAG: hypothetical protein R6U44_11205, partial [Archaeoglobaceae archaeon]
NFTNNRFKDTVYVTGNPHTHRLCKGSFYKIISVWREAWDESLNTVTPKTMLRYALKAEKRYPDKKIIVHFMQPHQPYIKDPYLDPYGYLRSFIREEGNKSPEHMKRTPLKRAKAGELSFEEVYEAYKRNLEAVIPYAFSLARGLKGKSVITADHGEAFNEWVFPFPFRVVEHPTSVRIPSLWLSA